MKIFIKEAMDMSREQDSKVEKMLKRYLAEPTNLWLYSDLPIEDRMALAYLSADEFMGADYKGDQVRQFVDGIKRVIDKPEAFWEQIKEKDPGRLQRLKSLDWSLEVVALEDVGVYPHFGGFPRQWSYGNVIDTAKALSTGTEFPEKRDHVLSMVSKWMTIIKFLPPILVPGEMLRSRDPEYKKTKWTIDDGNHRAVAAAIAGARNIVAFVGRMKTKESFMKIKMKEASLDRADFIVQDVKKIKPGDSITFHVWGEYLKGLLKTKSGNKWQIKGEDGKDYYYIPV